MPKGLRLFLSIADAGMLVYWGASALACLAVLTLPSTVMYAGYGTPDVDAWNWSFAPLDVTFSIVGLAAVRAARRESEAWVGLAIVSLCLTACAGGMAISYWALRGEFDAAWWLPNLALLLLPCIWLPSLISRTSRSLAA